MTRALPVFWLTCLLCASGCGSQNVLLDTKSKYLFLTFDSLCRPGEEVDLRARLQAGDLLHARAGAVVRFLRGGKLYKAAETDGHGIAAVTFVPETPGDYEFTAEVSPNGLSDEPPAPQKLLAACREADTPSLIVDLDKTLVASGFEQVLIGQVRPMPGSPEVMRRLAEKYAIIYLTHRPDYFGPKSKAWLRAHGYPVGPLLLSDIGGFLGGSGKFKTRAIGRLRERFANIRIGIGDKVSDAQAYDDNGMRAFLILDIPEPPTAEQLRELARALSPLPPRVQVVTSWSQIDRAVFGDGLYPPSEAKRMLIRRAKALDAKEGPPQAAGKADKKGK